MLQFKRKNNLSLLIQNLNSLYAQGAFKVFISLIKSAKMIGHHALISLLAVSSTGFRDIACRREYIRYIRLGGSFPTLYQSHQHQSCVCVWRIYIVYIHNTRETNICDTVIGIPITYAYTWTIAYRIWYDTCMVKPVCGDHLQTDKILINLLWKIEWCRMIQGRDW